jgi:hypothetical protein
MTDISNASEETNPRLEIQKKYAKWVDDVCEVCDWKTSITMDEVQGKYSELAIDLAISELSSLAEIATGSILQQIKERIKYLEKTKHSM